MSEIERSLRMLREDAIERDLLDLAITYGWSLMRLGADRLERSMKEITANKA